MSGGSAERSWLVPTASRLVRSEDGNAGVLGANVRELAVLGSRCEVLVPDEVEGQRAGQGRGAPAASSGKTDQRQGAEIRGPVSRGEHDSDRAVRVRVDEVEGICLVASEPARRQSNPQHVLPSNCRAAVELRATRN